MLWLPPRLDGPTLSKRVTYRVQSSIDLSFVSAPPTSCALFWPLPPPLPDQSQRVDESMMIDTTLLVHFFGKKGKAELTFDDFYRYHHDHTFCIQMNTWLIHTQ